MMIAPLIQMENVSFAYTPGRPVLEGVNFVLGRDERIGVVGGNGCGKTTFLHLLVGLIRPTGGTVRAFGRVRRKEADFHEVRLRAGLVFQHANDQLFCPTVLEDVAFGPLNLGKSPAEARVIADETLRLLDLGGFEDRITYELSGGEKRLVALATVLAMKPEVLLLDEPLAGLDNGVKRHVVDVLSDLPHARIIVSHDFDFLGKIVDSVSRMSDGALQPLDAVEEARSPLVSNGRVM